MRGLQDRKAKDMTMIIAMNKKERLQLRMIGTITAQRHRTRIKCKNLFRLHTHTHTQEDRCLRQNARNDNSPSAWAVFKITFTYWYIAQFTQTHAHTNLSLIDMNRAILRLQKVFSVRFSHPLLSLSSFCVDFIARVIISKCVPSGYVQCSFYIHRCVAMKLFGHRYLNNYESRIPFAKHKFEFLEMRQRRIERKHIAQRNFASARAILFSCLSLRPEVRKRNRNAILLPCYQRSTGYCCRVLKTVASALTNCLDFASASCTQPCTQYHSIVRTRVIHSRIRIVHVQRTGEARSLDWSQHSTQ